MDNPNLFLAAQTERAYLGPPRTSVLFACRNRWFFGAVAHRRRAAARRLYATAPAQELLSSQMPDPAWRAPGSVQQTSPCDPARVGDPDASRRPDAASQKRCNLLNRRGPLAPALRGGSGVVRRGAAVTGWTLGGRQVALAIPQQHIDKPHQLAGRQNERALVRVLGGLGIFGGIVVGVFRAVDAHTVGRLDQIVAQIAVATFAQRRIFGLEVARLFGLPGQASKLRDGRLVVEAADVAQFGNQPGSPDRAESRHRGQRLWDGRQLLGDGLIQGLELTLERANGRQGGAQHQAQRLLQHLIEAIGVARGALQGCCQSVWIGKAPAALGLKIGRQLLQPLLSQLLGRELIQYRTAGGAERVAKRGDLAVGRKRQEQKTQEVALLARQVLGQVAAKAGQALQRGVARVELEGRGQLAPEAQAFGNQEGIGAVGFRQRAKVLAKGCDQVRIEGVNARRERSEGWRVLECAGQVPPEQPSRLHPDTQLIDLIGLGELCQSGREGIGARLGVGNGPSGQRFFTVGEQEAHAGSVLRDIQADRGDGGHTEPPGQCQSGRSGRSRRHNILACDQNSRAELFVSDKLLPLPDAPSVELPEGQKSTSHPEQTVYRERSVSHGGAVFVPTGYTA